MPSWFEEYAAVCIGLIAGTLAHFGAKFSRGEIPSLLYVLGFLMQLGLIGLCAASFMQWLDLLSGVFEATLTCILALSTHEVVEWVKQRGWKRVVRALVPSLFDEEDEKGNSDV